jgi:hypothetical protein
MIATIPAISHSGETLPAATTKMYRGWPVGRTSCPEGGHFVTCISLRVALPLVANKISTPTNGRPTAKPQYKSRSDRPYRGPHKRVFVCGVAKRSGPARQRTLLPDRHLLRQGSLNFRYTLLQPYLSA